MKYYRLGVAFEIEECTIEEWAHTTSPLRRQFHISTVISSDVTVSTVFLGIDHRWSNYDGVKLPPLLFETMILGGIDDSCTWRTCTYSQAAKMHLAVVAWNQRRWWKPWTWFMKEPVINYETGDLQ